MILLLTLTALAADPTPPDAAQSDPYELGVIALKERRAADAARLLGEVVAASPERADAWWELGWARYAQGEFAGAIEAWQFVARLDPRHPEVAHWLAVTRARAQPATGPVKGEVPLQAAGAVIRFAAAGDTMMGADTGKGADGLAPDDGRDLLQGVDAWLKAADVALLNLEGPLADDLPQTKCGPDSTNCYAFRTPTRYVSVLTDAGVDGASLANNHAMDLGPPGMESTMATLDRAGIVHAGRYDDVAHLERDGVRIAMLGAHSGSCCLNVNEPDEVARAVIEADRDADIVVVFFHGGAEGASHRHVPGELEIGYGERRGDVKALARAAVDAGADLVLGSGPHVLRAMEVYRGRLIVYSMGNFCGFRQFGTEGGFGATSMVVEAELAANGVLTAARIQAVSLDPEGAPRPDPNTAAYDQVRELSEADFPETGVLVEADGTLRWR